MSTGWFTLLIVASAIQSLIAMNISDGVPESRGQEYRWVWLFYSIETGIGIVLNCLLLHLFFNINDNNKIGFYLMNVALNVVDLTFVTQFFVKSVVSYHYSSLWGGFNFDIMCYLDTVLNGAFVCSGALLIVGVSYLAMLYLTTGRKLSSLQTIAFAVGAGLYGIATVMFCIYTPGSGYGLDASGTVCFIVPSRIVIPVGFLFAFILPLVFLTYNLYYIHKAIAASQKLLEEQGMQGQAKGHYIYMVKKLGYFLFVISICELPTLLYKLYEMITAKYASPYFTGLAGISALSSSSLINPILFIVLNADIQEVFHQKYINQIGFLWMVISRLVCRCSKGKDKAIKVAVVTVPGSAENSQSSIKNVDYEKWVMWVTDPMLKKAFHEYGKKEYVMENFSFYDDIVRFHSEYDKYMNESLVLDDHGCIRNDHENSFLKVWEEMNVYANRLFIVYIKVPTAPLEININTATRERLLSILFRVTNRKPQSREVSISRASSNHSFRLSNRSDGGNDIDKNFSINSKKVWAANQELTKESETLQTADNRAEDYRSRGVDKVSSKIGAFQYFATESSQSLEVRFPDLLRIPKADVMTVIREYLLAFDECLDVVSYIIEGDVWPRFRKSMLYENTRRDHLSQCGNV